jgi:hypothetical protein
MKVEEGSVKQMLMTNGEEILACILEWKEGTYIEACNILSVIPYEIEGEDGKAYYILKPWVSYTDDIGKSSFINPNNVISLTEPSPVVVEQYRGSVEEISDGLKDDGDKVAKGVEGNVLSFTPKTLLTE